MPLVVLAIVFLPTAAVAGLVAVLMLFGAWEWGTLNALKDSGRIVLVAITAAVMAVVVAMRDTNAAVSSDSAIFALAALFWLAAIYLVRRFPALWPETLGRRGFALAVGVVVLTAPVLAVAYIHQADHGPFLVLLLCVMIWGADTGAYAAGRALGRRKLVPQVSPGKTVEGAAGGLVAAMAVGALGALVLGFDGWRTLAMTVLGGWIAAISIVGDLTISMFKRSVGVKDSGRLFPGHGGVLDRLDSMLAAAPWFVIGLHIVLMVP